MKAVVCSEFQFTVLLNLDAIHIVNNPPLWKHSIHDGPDGIRLKRNDDEVLSWNERIPLEDCRLLARRARNLIESAFR